MSKTIAVHVRYNSLYISLPSSAKQQREMTNSALSEEHELRRLVFVPSARRAQGTMLSCIRVRP